MQGKPLPRSILEEFCSLLSPSQRSLVENFYTGLNKLVSEAFCASSVPSQQASVAIDGITLCFSEGAASDNIEGFDIDEEVVDPPANPEVIGL